MRVRRKPWAARELETNSLLIQKPERYRGGWREYFSNDNPIFLELGCGMGGFITKSAAANPDKNYLALERVRMVIVGGMRRAREDGLSNIGFILRDAAGLTELFAPREISGIYINFCDPWDRKKKWVKKRLTHGSYLELYKKILAPGAGIILKTDNINLFEYSIKSFAESGFAVTDICRDLAASGRTDNITTEYEERFTAKGLPIYKLEAGII